VLAATFEEKWLPAKVKFGLVATKEEMFCGAGMLPCSAMLSAQTGRTANNKPMNHQIQCMTRA